MKASPFYYQFGARDADPKFPFVLAKQIHSDLIHIVHDANAILRGDALITATPGLAVGVATADCLPVLLADLEHRVVAAIHAGWRGTLKRITQKTVGVMRMNFGTDPAKVKAWLGPSIQVCCYEVGPEVIQEFRSQFHYADELFDKLEPDNPALIMLPRQHLVNRPNAVMRDLETQRANLNVEEANARQLRDAGVPARNIERGALCTACNIKTLHSYRKEGPRSGRQLSAIGIRRLG